MKFAITGALALAFLVSHTGAVAKPKGPCVLRGETGIYVCGDSGCACP